LSAEATREKGQVMFNQILREAMGISETATEALKALLTVGPLTLGEISTYSGLGYAVASKAIIELENEHLVRRIPGIVVRFTAMPPYGGFEAFLKDFQKIVKSIADGTGNAIDMALTAVNRNSAELKKETQQAGKSTLSQMISEIESLKENSSRNVSDMLGKLKQEIETTRGMVTDAIKKHVDEHRMKSGETKEEFLSGIDSVSAKFETIGKKYLKEATDMVSTSFGKYKTGVQSFVDALRTNLQQYSIETKETLARLERDITEIQNKLEEKSRATITVVKTRSSETLDTQRKTLGQKSLELQSAIRETMDNLAKTVSNYLTRLKSYVDDMIEKLSTETSTALSEFEGKTSTSLTERGSRFKSDITDCTQFLHKTLDTLGDSLAHEGEKSGLLAQELAENLTSASVSSLEDLKTRIEQTYSAGLVDLTETMSAMKKDLDDLSSSTITSCKTIASSLESTSSTIVPRYLKALETAVSDFEKNTPKTLLRMSKKIDALTSAVTEKAVSTVKSSIPPLESEVDKVVERVLSQVTPASTSAKTPKATSKRTAGTAKTFIAEVKELFAEVLERYHRNLLNEMKEILREQAKIEKATFEDESKKVWEDIGNILSTSVKKAKLELGKGDVAAAGMLPKLTEYSSSIERLVKLVQGTIDISIKKYAGEGEAAKKTTEELLSRQKEASEGALRALYEQTREQQTSSAKKANDLITEVHNSVSLTLTKHLDETDQCIQRNKSDLSEFVKQVAQSIEATRSATQTNITNQINSTLKTGRDVMESTNNSIRMTLLSTAKGFDDSTTNLQKELNGTVAQSIEEIKSVTGESTTKVSESRETLSSRIDEITGNTVKELGDSSDKHLSETLNTSSTMSASLSKITNMSLEEFKSEALGAKERFRRIMSSHLQEYEQDAFGASGTCGYLLTRSYEKYREISMVNERKLSETLLTNQTRCENAINTINSNLTGVIERNEALIKEETKNALAIYRDNIDKLRKASTGAEQVLHSAWMELEKTPQFAAEKTWQAVTRTAIMSHIQEMVKRTRSHIVVVLPTLKEAPLDEIKSARKSTRVTLVLSDMTGDQKEIGMLAEVTRQTNVTIRAARDISCFGCSRDNEEMLFAPLAPTDSELVGVVSTMENYVQFFDRFVLPALLGSSHDLREPPAQGTPPRKP